MTDNTEMVKTEENEVSLFSSLPEEYIKQLTPAKLRMINLYLTGLYSQKQIAQLLNMSTSGLAKWLKEDAVQCAIRTIQEKEFMLIDSNLKTLRFKAVDTLSDLMDNAVMENVKLAAAKDILDRTGHKSVQQIKVDKKVTSIEQQLKGLSEFNINKDDIVDVDEITELIKNE